MSAVQELSIACPDRTFVHRDARRICDTVLRNPRGRTVVIDLNGATDATTAAFATLVLLRRQLRRLGRDLRLTGLTGRAAKVYQFSRLSEVLPVA